MSSSRSAWLYASMSAASLASRLFCCQYWIFSFIYSYGS
nr:MAG TPA: hypothetical protein [Caudoviricetes sp.]